MTGPALPLRPPTLALLAALAVALGLDLRVALRGERKPVSKEVMAKAKELLLAQQKPGDLIVHSPILSVAELSELGTLPARPDLPTPELRAARRTLVLDLSAHPVFGLGPKSERIVIGEGLELSVVPPSGGDSVAMFDLYADLDRAELSIERPAGQVTSRCTAPRAEGGRSCPGEAEWLYLARRDLVIGGKNSPCIWAHPTTGGVIVFQLPAVPEPPPGRKLELRLSAGMTDDAVQGTADGAAVRTDVSQGGVARGGLTVENRVGWVRASVSVVGQQPIELRVTTPRDGRRHHCLNAQVVEVP